MPLLRLRCAVIATPHLCRQRAAGLVAGLIRRLLGLIQELLHRSIEVVPRLLEQVLEFHIAAPAAA
jgi:hypothetical protein